ncbi:hypothetical protein N7490_001877 [Penicillium lividum]|nr:hypothetical protein N7490_001877 [Penicillium lividum]
MSPRGILSWLVQEEENLLQWLDENRKKYHILRKNGRTTARSPRRQGHRNRRKPRRRSIEQTIIHSDASAVAATHSNIDLWFQTVLASESGSAESSESAMTRGSISDRLTPALTKFRPKKPRSSSWIWEYVHRMCATGRMDL